MAGATATSEEQTNWQQQRAKERRVSSVNTIASHSSSSVVQCCLTTRAIEGRSYALQELRREGRAGGECSGSSNGRVSSIESAMPHSYSAEGALRLRSLQCALRMHEGLLQVRARCAGQWREECGCMQETMASPVDFLCLQARSKCISDKLATQIRSCNHDSRAKRSSSHKRGARPLRLMRDL